MSRMLPATIPVGLARDPHAVCRDCGEHQIPSLAGAGEHVCPNADRALGYGPGDHVQVRLVDGWHSAWACGVRRFGPSQAIEVEVKVGVTVWWISADLVKASPTTHTDAEEATA